MYLSCVQPGSFSGSRWRTDCQTDENDRDNRLNKARPAVFNSGRSGSIAADLMPIRLAGKEKVLARHFVYDAVVKLKPETDEK